MLIKLKKNFVALMTGSRHCKGLNMAAISFQEFPFLVNFLKNLDRQTWTKWALVGF